MILIPAIDIKNNNCVRLNRGDIYNSFKFSENSLISINRWINENSKRIHLVNLDGAILDKNRNLLTIKNLLNYSNNNIRTQLGGGVRNLDIVDYYFDNSLSYIILGTRAILDLRFLETVCAKYVKKVILALDLKNLKIAIEGWKKYYNKNLFNFLKSLKIYPLESVIYTDVSKDGTLTGLNFKNFLKIHSFLDKPLIISGGLSNLHDIKKTFSFQIKNLMGIICGVSIYKGNINFRFSNNKINYFNNFYIS